MAVFKDAKVTGINRNGETVISATFQLFGQNFYALNGGPHFNFSEGISLFVNCETQVEVDELWEKLSEDGEKGRCGWLKDKFGISWQIVPAVLGRLMSGGGDLQKAQRVMQAMMQMNKLIIEDLQKAYDG